MLHDVLQTQTQIRFRKGRIISEGLRRLSGIHSDIYKNIWRRTTDLPQRQKRARDQRNRDAHALAKSKAKADIVSKTSEEPTFEVQPQPRTDARPRTSVFSLEGAAKKATAGVLGVLRRNERIVQDQAGDLLGRFEDESQIDGDNDDDFDRTEKTAAELGK